MAEPLRLRAPGSKSQTQRELLLSALAAGESVLEDALDCGDSRCLRAALASLGAVVDDGPPLRIRGGPLAPGEAPLWCGDGGTVLRFLAPLSLLFDRPLRLDGSERLGERPLEELIGALAGLGVEARRPGHGWLPLLLQRTSPAERGHSVAVDVSRSSQFASGLLMVAPCLPGGLELELRGPPVSRPYLEMTLQAMRARGATVEEAGALLRVAPGGYQARRVRVEADWSSAAFLLAGGFVLGREVVVENADPRSVQGDRAVVAHLAELGRQRPHRLDLTDCPDLVAPLAVAAAFAAHGTCLEGIGHARLKESDRIATLARGLSEAGIEVVERPEALLIEPHAGSPLRPVRLDPRGDHRMAMAFALLSLRQPGIELADRACVGKSYPGFFEALSRLRGAGGEP
jgi:3-phosphoshikimate 1-carboxyvinyltransferase